MNLLDAFKQYIKDAMPGGALNPEWTPERVSAAKDVASAVLPYGGLLDVQGDIEQGNYGSAAVNTGLLAIPMIAGPLRPGGLKKVEEALIALSKGERPRTSVIGDLTQKQFDELNTLRVAKGYAPLKSSEVLYNGTHHYGSRTRKDNNSIPEMLDQIQNSLDEASYAIPHAKTPGLFSPKVRVNEFGQPVNDYGVIEGGGSRPTWLFSAYGKQIDKK